MKKISMQLEKANLKKTKHRLLILKILAETNDFLSADDLFIRAKQSDTKISLSTVYRILDSFAEKKIVSTLNIDNSKQVYYEMAHQEHAHHLICLDCQSVIHIKDCPIHDYQSQLSKTYNFQVKRHSLEFYGYCSKCQKSKKNQ